LLGENKEKFLNFKFCALRNRKVSSLRLFLSLCNYLTLKFSFYSRFPTVKPIAVHITTREKFVSAEKSYDVECKSSGSRPEAVLTWWKGSRQIKRMAKNVSICTSP
jgi:CD80-like C2-set immunoglobulin domain